MSCTIISSSLLNLEHDVGSADWKYMAWRLNDNPWSNTNTWSGSSSIFVGAPREHDVVAWTNVDRLTDMLQWACVCMREAFLAVEIHGPKARGAFFPDEGDLTARESTALEH
ncbi:hypothetical protein F2Q68_00039281 [Brassica cretica]|uniref:Uncharacterized protein n=1 Tax=Brassica cretica TaxID=69181 RepID=A0A8S9MJB1_BRACR|nr:hypothetical protein F2Q68_00039281 [Brassica cretica]